jgi:hemoglobin
MNHTAPMGSSLSAARLALVGSLALLLYGLPCGIEAQTARSLFERIGGQPVIEAVVADTIDHVAADPHLNQSFEGTNLKRIKRLLAEQICDITGGPCHYSGDTVRQVHAGHHISEAEFYGLVQIMRNALLAHHVALRERNELLALLAPMKRDVVEAPARPSPGGS